MAAITLKQLRALLEGAPGDARIEAVRAGKRAVAEELYAVTQRIDDARASKRSPLQADYMLLAGWNDVSHVLKDLEFAMATGVEADQTACLARLKTLLERQAGLATPADPGSK